METDLVYNRLQSYTKEDNIIHKKALVLISGLKAQLGDLKGEQGVKKYIKNLINLVKIETTDKGSHNIQNTEAMMLILAVAVKVAEMDSRKFTDDLLEIISFFGDQSFFQKYVLIILEQLMLTRTYEELQSHVDPVCVAFELFSMDNLIFTKNKEVFLQMIKVFNKLFKSSNNNILFFSDSNVKSEMSISTVCKYTLIRRIVEKLKSYIKGMYTEFEDNDDDNITILQSKKVKNLTLGESENVLNLLIAIIQIFPIEYINDIVYELNKLIENCDTSKLLTQALLVIEMAFIAKTLSVDLIEDILSTMLNIDLQLQTDSKINISLTSAYMKSITQAILALNKHSLFTSIKYLPSLISKLSQFIKEENFDEDKILTSEADLLKNPAIITYEDDKDKRNKTENLSLSELKSRTVIYIQSIFYSSINNIITKIFTKTNIEELIKNNFKDKSKNEDIIADLVIEDENKTKDFNAIIEDLVKELIFLVDTEFYLDLKVGYNLLFNFIEKIASYPKYFRVYVDTILMETKEKYESFLSTLNKDATRRSKQEENSLLYFKIFIGKCFNLFPAAYLSQHISLDLLSFDLESEDYTENSYVWVIPYIEKFLKTEGTQSIADYSEFFQNSVKELLTKIQLLKVDIRNINASGNENKNNNSGNNNTNANTTVNNPISNTNNLISNVENNLMMIDEDEMDERFEDNNSSKHVKQLKLGRYQLILSQIFQLLPYFCHLRDSKSTDEISELFSYIEVMNLHWESCEHSSALLQNSENTNRFNRKIIYKSVQKLLENLIKIDNKNLIEFFIQPDLGERFFQDTIKNLTYLITNGNKHMGFKLNDESLQKSAMSCLSMFCKVVKEDVILNVIGTQLEKFNSAVIMNNLFTNNPNNSIITDDNDSNIAQLNLTIDNNNSNINARSNVDKHTNSRYDEIQQMAVRVQLIIYLVKSITINKSIFDILVNFHKNFFYNYTNAVNNNINMTRLYNSKSFKLIVKSFIDLFMLLLEKTENSGNSLELFKSFWENQGLKVLSSKQKVRILQYAFRILFTDFKKEKGKLTMEHLQSSINSTSIIIEIICLTKDINRKVRNSSFDLIAEISDFMAECDLFRDWIKLLVASLVSTNSFLVSGVINTLSRVFWQQRDETRLLCQTAETVLMLLKENNTEITKSIFLFIRVLVYIIGNKTETVEDSINSIKQIKTYNLKNFATMFLPLILKSLINKEFKVKIRNLLKCLMLKLGFEEVKQIVGNENIALLNYINKHIIKKHEKYLTEEEIYYKNKHKDLLLSNTNNEMNLDESVFNDNDDMFLDEEEEYINKEFKKEEKAYINDDEDFLENLNRWEIDEEDEEERKRKRELSFSQKAKQEDYLDKLFNSNDVELQNHFYMNPYVTDKKKNKKNDDDEILMNKDKEVFYDKKKGKLIVKDVEDKDSRVKKNNKPNDNTVNANSTNSCSMLKQKRGKTNINFDEEINENDINDNSNSKFKSLSNSKMSDVDFLKQYNVSKKDLQSLSLNSNINEYSSNKKLKAGDTKKSHFVKFSGDEYKSKSGKGDKLLKGKYEPFAYIQLNPKSVLDSKNSKDNMKVFEQIMRPNKKNK